MCVVTFLLGSSTRDSYDVTTFPKSAGLGEEKDLVGREDADNRKKGGLSNDRGMIDARSINSDWAARGSGVLVPVLIKYRQYLY